jgi:hypothetical protein
LTKTIPTGAKRARGWAAKLERLTKLSAIPVFFSKLRNLPGFAIYPGDLPDDSLGMRTSDKVPISDFGCVSWIRFDSFVSKS